MLNRKPIESRYIKESLVKTKFEIFSGSTDLAEGVVEVEFPGKNKIPCFISFEEEKHPRICVCIFRMTQKEEDFYVMGYSVCNEFDNFSYAQGREVSADRAYSRLSEISEETQRILPTKKDLERIPKHLRNEFIDICTEFFKKYGELV